MGTLRRYPGFRAVWTGQLLSQFGNAVFLVMGLWEIQLRSPQLLAGAGLAMMLPQVLALAGGVLVDRHGPGRLMLYTDIARGVAVLAGLAALALPGGLIPAVIALLAVNSLGSALFAPAESTLIPLLVRTEDLSAANGVYSLTSQISSAVGSAIGGAAISAVGVALVFGVDMGSFWLSALAIALMLRTLAPRRRAGAPASTGAQPQGFADSLREGMAVLRRLPIVMTLLPLIVVGNFAFMVAFTMLPYWIHHTLQAGSAAYGLIDAAWAVGLVGGGLSVGALGKLSLRQTSAIAFGLQGLATLIFAASASSWLSGGLLLVAGFGNGVGNALLLTMLQRLVPEAARGRVFGLMVTLFSLANPFGAFAAGVLLNVVPLYVPWLAAGIWGIAFGVGLWRAVPDDMTPYEGAMAQ